MQQFKVLQCPLRVQLDALRCSDKTAARRPGQTPSDFSLR